MILSKRLSDDVTEYFDTTFKFVETFNRQTGEYMRTGILKKDEDGEVVDTNEDPFMRSFPNLLDIGIIGSRCKAADFCTANCYQGTISQFGSDMSLELFKSIIDQSKDKVQQVALGGSGDPNTHEHFEEILRYARGNNIVPSYTTSGFFIDSHIANITKELCGAVAVSWCHEPSYRDKAIKHFMDAGCITNIHYVVNNKTIDEAIWQIKHARSMRANAPFVRFPNHISNVIFLTHKPIGLGSDKLTLDVSDPRVKELAEAIDNNKNDFGVGIDACMVPMLLNHATKINQDSISSCDASTYSAYIDAGGAMMVCSMDVHSRGTVCDLNKMTMDQAWQSSEFGSFRNKLSFACPGCKDKSNCHGGCHLLPEITLCNRKERV